MYLYLVPVMNWKVKERAKMSLMVNFFIANYPTQTYSSTLVLMHKSIYIRTYIVLVIKEEISQPLTLYQNKPFTPIL